MDRKSRECRKVERLSAAYSEPDYRYNRYLQKATAIPLQQPQGIRNGVCYLLQTGTDEAGLALRLSVYLLVITMTRRLSEDSCVPGRIRLLGLSGTISMLHAAIDSFRLAVSKL